MTAQTLNNKHYLIIGLGLTGLSCARFCKKHDLSFELCDTRSDLPGLEAIRQEFPGIAIRLGDLTVDFLAGFDELLVSPGISTRTALFREAAVRGVRISGDIQLFSEYAQKPVVAITGSNGKSTVTTLVNELINASGKRAVAGGNLGTPALDLLSASGVDVYVVELSSFQLETTTDLGAEAAVILNISPDHMDRYDGMADYEDAKQRIFQSVNQTLINRDDDHTRPTDPRVVVSSTFGLSEPQAGQFGIADIDGEQWLMKGDEPLVKSADLRIRGSHNVANALAALALVDLLGIDIYRCLTALVNFPGLAHRCQWVSTIRGVDYFNDSKGTNVGSTVAAVKGLSAQLKGRIWLLAGGEGKGQDFTELADICSASPVAEVLTYGADRAKIAADISSQVATSDWLALEDALADASARAQAGDIILLSPACASFDQFRNYVHRGEFFCQCVEELQ